MWGIGGVVLAGSRGVAFLMLSLAIGAMGPEPGGRGCGRECATACCGGRGRAMEWTVPLPSSEKRSGSSPSVILDGFELEYGCSFRIRASRRLRCA